MPEHIPMHLPVHVPVRQPIVKALADAADLVADYDRRSGTTRRPVDREDYEPMVQQLAALAGAVLNAQASVSLLAPTVSGARFDAGPGSAVARSLAKAVEYLNTNGADIMASPRDILSAYAADNTASAYARLIGLHGTVLYGIEKCARDDLSTLHKRGVEDLVTAAALLAAGVVDDTTVTKGN